MGFLQVQCTRRDLYNGSHDRSSQVDAAIYVLQFFLVNGVPPVQCCVDKSFLNSTISDFIIQYIIYACDGRTQILYVQHILSGYVKSRNQKINSRISFYWEAY